MGWKGVIRSIGAAHNQAVRERERENRRSVKEQGRLQKKLQNIADSRGKIALALNNDYAAGKIDRAEYEILSKRLSDVTDELLVFGKSAAVTLAKRYVCGKIDENQFAEMKSEFIPDQLEEEQRVISSQVNKKQEALRAFHEACTTKHDRCHKCSKEKGFFTPLYQTDGHFLCGKCREELNQIKYFAGFNGSYILAEPCYIEGQMNLHVALKSEWL